MLWKRLSNAKLEREFETLRGSIFSHIFPNGVRQTATMAAILRICSASSRNLSLTASTTIDPTYHADRNLLMNAAVANTHTLPNATGTGNTYRFMVGTVNTSNYLIKTNRGADTFDGLILNVDTDTSGAMRGWSPGATDDTITLNGTTTGGSSIGDWIEVRDIATNQWAVSGVTSGTGTVATPFSDTVA